MGGARRLRIEPHRQPGLGHVILGLAYRIFAEMEDRGGEHGAGMAVADALDQMIEIADAAGGDDRHRYGVGNGAGQRKIVTVPGAVAVHRSEQDFPGAERCHFARVSDGVDAGRIAAAMGENLPARRLARFRHALGVDRDHNALVAEFSAASLTKSRRATAAVLIETLSAPEVSSAWMSSMVRTPPPTVSGMKQASAVRRTTSSMMPRFSWLAVMSRKVSSSAPASS